MVLVVWTDTVNPVFIFNIIREVYKRKLHPFCVITCPGIQSEKIRCQRFDT